MRNFLKASLLALLIPLSVQCQNEKSILNPSEVAIDAIFETYDNPDSPGAAIAVVHKGKVLFKKGYGSANLEYDIPITPSTIFHIASVSKQFTVFALMLLVEEGKLALDDDIRKHLPEVPDFGEKITLRHLANHTSGIRDQWELLILGGWRMDDVITTEHILSMVSRQRELNFIPGERYLYSNTGFTLLAEVVARISKQSFSRFTYANIFEPLGMTSTQFYDDHERVVKNRAYSYRPQRNGEIKKAPLNYANVGATSLFTTAEDLALWAHNLHHPKVGTSNMIEQMNTRTVFNNGNSFGGGLGQFVNLYRGLEQVQHGGSDAGYRTFLSRFPNQDFSVIILSNNARFNPRNIAAAVTDLYLQPYYQQNTNATTTSKTPDFKEISNEELKKHSGDYWNHEDGFATQVYVENDHLILSRDGRPDKLGALSENEFVVMNGRNNVFVTFEYEKTKQQVLYIKIGANPRMRLESYNPTSYPLKNIDDYVGTYYSPELDTHYDIVVKDGKLITKHQRANDYQLNPIMKDKFDGNDWSFDQISFERNTKNEVIGFRISNSRVKGISFEKE